MANDLLIEEFNQCVTQLADGATIDDCVQLFPQHQNELRVMLEATRIPQKAEVSLDDVRYSQARVRLQFEKALVESAPHRQSFPLQRVASIIFVILFMGILLTTGIVVVAQDSLPGDTLYGVKRWSEQVQLSVVSDKDALQATFNQRRIDETKQVIQLRREVDVRFVGMIDRIGERAIYISEFEIELADNIQTIEFITGMRVDVFARTRIDQPLLATDIRILDRVDRDREMEVRPTTTIERIEGTPTNEIIVSPTRPDATHDPSSTLQPTTDDLRDRPTRDSTLTPSDVRAIESSSTHTTDCVDSPPDGWIQYTVQSGDTPLGIAIGTDISLDQFLAINCDLNPRFIRVGDVVYVPVEPRLLRTPTPTQRPRDIQPIDPIQQPTNTPDNVRPTRTATRQESDSSSERERDRNNSGNNGDGRR